MGRVRRPLETKKKNKKGKCSNNYSKSSNNRINRCKSFISIVVTAQMVGVLRNSKYWSNKNSNNSGGNSSRSNSNSRTVTVIIEIVALMLAIVAIILRVVVIVEK